MDGSSDYFFDFLFDSMRTKIVVEFTRLWTEDKALVLK